MEKAKVGKKGAAKKLTQKLKKMRETPVSKGVFQIIEDAQRNDAPMPQRKIACPKPDLER